MAEIAGFNTELLPKRLLTLETVVRDLFPYGGHIEQATFWTGLRPMTQDGTPLVGATALKNLYLNTGTLGWPMTCSSGRLLADIISARVPDIRYDDLSAPVIRLGLMPSRCATDLRPHRAAVSL